MGYKPGYLTLGATNPIHCPRVETVWAQVVNQETGPFRISIAVSELQEIRCCHGPGQLDSGAWAQPAAGVKANVSFGEKGSHESCIVRHTLFFALLDQPPKPRMNRELHHSTTPNGYAAAGIDGAETRQEFFRCVQRRWSRGFEPGKCPRIRDSGAMQCEKRLGKVGPPDFR
jgi:hypothetical protein